jgi:hypothetical protein
MLQQSLPPFNGILIVESVSACSPNNTITKTTTGDEDTECLFNLYKLPVERLEQYFEANDIEDEKKMAQLSIIEKLFLAMKCSFYVVGFHRVELHCTFTDPKAKPPLLLK